MHPYSDDLRQRVLAAVDRKEFSLRQIARLFCVSLSFLVRLLQRRRQTGSSRPKPHGGGRVRQLDETALGRLLELVRQQPDATLAELRDRLGSKCSLSTLCRALRRAGITRKKKTAHADERDTPAVRKRRSDFDRRMADVEPAHLVFVDETGATTAMARTYGRAPAGERAVGSAPGQWQNVTLIAGLRSTGVLAPLAFAGATDAPAFRTYVEEILAPQLRRGDVVVWDNLSPHQQAAVVEAVEAVGARVEPLPPYSPDKSPIEEMFSKVKGCLRTLAARTTETVITALGTALRQVTFQDIYGWFQHRCAYAMR